MKYSFSEMQERRKKIHRSEKYTVYDIADIMGTSVRTVRRKIQKYGIQPIDVFEWKYFYIGHDVRKLFRDYTEDIPRHRRADMLAKKEQRRNQLEERLQQ